MTIPELVNPDEVVTKSLLRLVNLPGLARPAALITLDNGLDHRRPNTFGPGGLMSLDAALHDALAADPAFIAVTGKPYIFCVGADLSAMSLLTSRETSCQYLLRQRVGLAEHAHATLRAASPYSVAASVASQPRVFCNAASRTDRRASSNFLSSMAAR